MSVPVGEGSWEEEVLMLRRWLAQDKLATMQEPKRPRCRHPSTGAAKFLQRGNGRRRPQPHAVETAFVEEPVIWPPGHPEAPDAQASQAIQPSERGKGTGKDPETRSSLLIAHWEAFANRLLRKRARKHMFKAMLVERRRRAIIMR